MPSSDHRACSTAQHGTARQEHSRVSTVLMHLVHWLTANQHNTFHVILRAEEVKRAPTHMSWWAGWWAAVLESTWQTKYSAAIIACALHCILYSCRNCSEICGSVIPT